jgi:hypothetical protein
VTVPHQASQYPRESWVTTYQPCCTTALESKHTRLRKAAWGKDVGPTRGFTASPRVGPGATVGTLRTGYPRVQVSSQENNSHLPAGGSSEAATCPPHSSGSCLPARGSSGAAMCHRGSSAHLLAQGSSRAATCPEDGLCRLQAIKQISPDDLAIMISIGVGRGYLPRHYVTRAAPHVCKACNRRPIKCR